MQNTQMQLALISFTPAACVLLYTVGLDQEYLGYERRWTILIFCAYSSFFVQSRLSLPF